MAELEQALAKLDESVKAKQQARRQIQIDEKKNLRARHPDMADALQAITQVFGPDRGIKRIRVRDETGVILDSNRWKA